MVAGNNVLGLVDHILHHVGLGVGVAAVLILRASEGQDQPEHEGQQQKADAELTEERRSQVGTGDRSERIRTYNFPQGRVTDHRINLTLYKLDNILNGDIDEFIQALAEARRAELMKEAEDE